MNEFGRKAIGHMMAGSGPDLLKVVHYPGYITFYRGDPGVEVPLDPSLSALLRAAFVARDGFTLSRVWLSHLEASR